MNCDRCGAPAREHGWTAINRDGRTLTLCGHHFADHRDALVKQGWTLVELAVIAETEKAGELSGFHSEG